VAHRIEMTLEFHRVRNPLGDTLAVRVTLDLLFTIKREFGRQNLLSSLASPLGTLPLVSAEEVVDMNTF